ncbi:DNA polymerase III beta subunit [Bradyrhizobium sp. USDA 4504]
MKVTVERAQLLRSLGHVHRVVERRNTIPILGNVLIRAEGAKLSLKATDLDLEVTETLAAETGTAGSTTVPAHMFYDIVRKLPDGSQIVLEADGDRSVLAVRAGRSRFTLQTLPESDFPGLAAGDMTHSFSLPASDIKRLIDRTQFAISTEETRYYLNGIYLHAAGSAKAATLRGVATDGHRLAQIDLALPKGATGMPGVIVPRKTVGEVQRLIEGDDAEISIELSDGKIRFTLGNVVLTSKLIDGTFPDYGPRHSAEQRQGTRRRQEGFRGRRRPRLDDFQRTRPRGEARTVRGQAGALGHQPGFRQRHRGARGRVRLRRARYRLQLALSARHRRPDRG